MEWATIEGHYWLEIRISNKKDGVKNESGIAGAENLKAGMQNGVRNRLIKIFKDNDIKVNDSILKQLQGGLTPLDS